jgi:hypothetical protein
VGLDEVANVAGIADEGGSSEILHLYGKSVFDGEPDVATGNGSLLVLVGEASNGNGCGGVYEFGVEVEVVVVLALNFDLLLSG